MNRRDFFKGFGAGIQRVSQPPPPKVERPAVPFQIMPSAGSPRQYSVGMRVLVKDVRAWLCRDSLGFYAVDADCPHLGCLVQWVETQWMCPCHGSVFSASGTPQAGPAPHGLRFLYIDLDDAGNLVIQRDKTVSPDERFIA